VSITTENGLTLVEGFCSPAEVKALVELARWRDVLEVGVWKGRCTIPMARVARSLVAVDHFRGDAYTGEANTLPEFMANIREYGVQDRVQLVIGPFAKSLDLLALSRFGLLIYDADHDAQPTAFALDHFAANLGCGAVIACHDYDYSQVKVEVDRVAVLLGRRVRVVDRLAILEEPT